MNISTTSHGRTTVGSSFGVRAVSLVGAAGTVGSLRGRRRGGRRGGWMGAGRLWALAASLMSASSVFGQIAGEHVAAGTASFQRSGSFTQITASNNAIINYRQFDVRPYETVRFVQPDSLSRVLNRINSNVPSRIEGRIQSNGRVYLVNPSGVYFAKGAMLNVGGIYAAAGNISDGDFLRGVNRFTTTPGSRVVNEGQIHGDIVGLIGDQVYNFGAIDAPNGTVAMVQGDSVLLGERDGHVFAKVETTPEQQAERFVGPTAPKGAGGGSASGSGQSAASARNGRFGAGDIYGLAVWNKGTVKAKNIHIEAQRSVVKVEGTLDASNPTPGGTGGTVKVLGEYVGLYDAKVDVSGDSGGGTALIGGNVKGKGEERTSRATYTSEGSVVKADAINSGTGGTVAVWSDEVTRTYSAISAKGGSTSGDGGFVETSSKGVVSLGVAPTLSSAGGQGGTWLIDPVNITISNGADANITASSPFLPTSAATASNLSVATLVSALSGGASVIVNTQNGFDHGGDLGDITVQNAIDFNATGTNALSLIADNDIIIDANIFDSVGASADALSLVLKADSDLNGTGGVTVNADITTGTGSFLSTGATFASTAGSTISSDANVTILSRTGGITLGDNVSANTSGGGVRLGAAGTITQTGGTITTDLLSARTTAGDITLQRTGNNATTVALSNTNAGGVVSYGADSNAFTVGTVSADPAIVVGGTVDAGGNVAATTGVTSSGSVLLVGTTTLNINAPISAVGQTVRLVATDATLGTVVQTTGIDGSITADRLGVIAAQSVALSASGSSNSVDFFAASSSGGGSPSLTYRDVGAFQVDQVTSLGAFDLTTGVTVDGDALLVSGGLMTLNQDINVGANTVRLSSAAGITQAGGAITADLLGVRAGGAAILTSGTNDVNSVAGNNSSTGAAFSYTDADDVAVSLVGGVGGGLFNEVSGITATDGNVFVQTGAGNTGLLTLLNSINAGSGDITLTADAMTFSGGANSIGGPSGTLGALTIQPVTASRPIEIGIASGTGTVGSLSLNDAEILAFRDGLSRITIGVANGTGAVSVLSSTFTDPVNILSGTSGTITVGDTVDLGAVSTGGNDLLLYSGGLITLNTNVNAGAGTIRLRSGAGITQPGPGIVTASSLGVDAADDVFMASVANSVGTFAGLNNTPGKIIQFSSNGMIVNTVSALASLFPSTSGVQTTISGGLGDIYLDAGTGTLDIRQPISALGSPGAVRLLGTNITQTSAGVITADRLGVRATDTIDLSSAANSVGVFAARSSGGTTRSASFRDVDGFAIDQVSASGGFAVTNGVTVDNGNITLQTGAGNSGLLTINSGFTLNAGSGDITLTADAMALNGGADSIGGPSGSLGSVTIQPVTLARPIEIGVPSGDGPATSLSLNDAEILALRNGLSRITIGRSNGTGAVDVQSANFNDAVNILSGASGTIDINGAVTTNDNDLLLFSGGAMTLANDITTGAGVVRLRSGAGIDQTSGSISSGALGVRSAGDVTLLSATNVFDIFAASDSASGSFVNVISEITHPVFIGTVSASGGDFSAVNGISTTGGGWIAFVGGTLGITQPIVSAGSGGVVRLTGSNITQSASGTITADTLGVRSYVGAINLDQANNVQTAAFEAPSGSSIVYRDSDGFTLGSVAGITIAFGLDFETANGAQFFTANNYGAGDGSGDIYLHAGAGALTLTQTADAKGAQTTGGLVRLANSGAGNAITQSGSGIIIGSSLGVRSDGDVTLNLVTNDVGVLAAALGSSGAALQYRDASGFDVGSIAALTTFAQTDGITTTSGDVLLQGAGNLSLANSIDAGSATVRLFSTTGGVAQPGGGITAGTLGVNVPGTIELRGTNAVGTLAANTATSGAGIEFRNTGSGTLTVGTVGTLGQFLSTSGLVVTDADIAVNSAGAQVYTQDVTAGANAIRLSSGGGISQTAGEITGIALGVRANGTVDLPGNNDVVSFAAANTGTGAGVTFHDINSLDVTNVGGIGSGLFNAVSGITTVDGNATLDVDSVLNINNAVALGAGTAILDSGGTINQTAPITAGSLGVTALGTVTLAHASNDVSNLSISTGIGDIRYVDLTGLTLTPVGSATNALSTPDGDARITAGGAIDVAGNVVMIGSGAGIVTFDTLGGGVTQSAGSIVANELGVDANGAINLSRPDNDVDVFAANAQFGTGHDVAFVDTDDLAIGFVANSLGSPVQGVESPGGSVLIQAGQGLAVNENISAATTLELRAARGAGGLGNLTFDVGQTMQAESITLIAGNGAGAATTATVDVKTNLPTFLGTAGSGSSPGTFVLKSDTDIGDDQIPRASQFGAGVTGMIYTLESMDGMVTINPIRQADVNNTNLTLAAFNGIKILTDLTLQGLSANGSITTGSLDITPGDLSFNGAITLSGPDVVFAAKEINFNPGTTITGGTNLTLRPSLSGGEMNVGLASSSTDPMAGFLDITSAELAILRNANLTSLTLGSATGTGTLRLLLANPMAPDTQVYNTNLTLAMGGAGGTIVQTTGIENAGKRITYVGPLLVSNDVFINTVNSGNTTGADIAFTGAVDSGESGFFKNNFALNVNSGSAGVISFSQPVGATKELRTLTTAGATTNLKSVKTLNAQSYSGAVVINSATVLQTTGAAGDDVTFNGTVNDATSGTDSLTVNAGSGAVTFGQAVGGVTPLASVTTTGTTALNNISTTGNQSYTGASTIAADATLASTTGNVVFLGTGTVDSAGGAHALTVSTNTTGGQVNFGGAVGSASPLTNVNVTGAQLTLRSVTTTGNQTYTASTTLADPTVNLVADAADGGGDITFNGTVNGATVNGTDLTLNAGTGVINFGAAVGNGIALKSLAANSTGGITLRNVTTSGQQTYTGPVTLGGSAGTVVRLDSSPATGGGVKFLGDVNGTPGLLVTSNKNELGNVTTTGPQTYNGLATILNGNISAGAQVLFAGAVTLGGTAGSTINVGTVGAGDVIFDRTVNGPDALVVSAAGATGNVAFNGVVGGTAALRSLAVTAPNITLGGSAASINTRDGGITLTGGTRLQASSVSLNSVGGSAADILLDGTVTGTSALANSLVLNAGAGNATIRATVGSDAIPLGGIVSTAATTQIVAPGATTGQVIAGSLGVTGATVLGDATGPVSVDVRNPPDRLAVQSDVMRFMGPVTLDHNATLRLGNGSVFFSSTVDSASDVTPRSLTLTSTLTPDLFLKTGDASVQAPIKFNAPIGSIHKLGTLKVDGLTSVPLAATMVMAGRVAGKGEAEQAFFDDNGSLVIGTGFNGLDAANVRRIVAENIDFSENQKLTSVGGLSLIATGTDLVAGSLNVGDLNSFGEISIQASRITFSPRGASDVLIAPGVLDGVLTRQLRDTFDTGTDFVSTGSVRFTGVTQTLNNVSIAVLNGSVTLNGGPVTKKIVLGRGIFDAAGSTFDRTKLLPDQNPGATNGLGLDFASNIKQNTGLANALASALASDPGSGGAGDSVSLPGDLRDKLLNIGIYTRDDDEDEDAILSGRSLYMDVPSLALPSGPLGDYAISAQRLSRGPVLRVLEAYDDLAGTDPATRRERYREVGDKVADAWGRYRDTLAPEAEPDALAFRRYAEVTPSEGEALAQLNKIRVVLQRLDELGLAAMEVRVPKNILLAELKPQQQYDMTESQLEEAATGVRSAALASK